MKKQNKGRWRERWMVILRLAVVEKWKGMGIRNVGKRVIIKKKNVNVKTNYGKIEKKNDNDVDADVVQLEYSNNKGYTLAFRCTPSVPICFFSIPFWDVPKYCLVSKNKSH